MSRVIMAGALGNFDVPSILQAVSLSRQYTLLRLWDSDKRESGEIRVKAGQLLDASCAGRRGKAALHSLLRGKHHSFRVERVADPVNLPEPVGPLAALLLDMPQPVHQAPPPPPPLPSSVATGATPAVRLAHVPQVPTSSSVPSDVSDRLAKLPAVTQAVVCSRVKQQSWEWARDGAELSAEQLRGLATMLEEGDAASMRCTTFELPEAVVVVRPGDGGIVWACAFPRSTPLGLVRLVADAAHSILSGQADWGPAR